MFLDSRPLMSPVDSNLLCKLHGSYGPTFVNSDCHYNTLEMLSYI